jgi:hypothetical protein
MGITALGDAETGSIPTASATTHSTHLAHSGDLQNRPTLGGISVAGFGPLGFRREKRPDFGRSLRFQKPVHGGEKDCRFSALMSWSVKDNRCRIAPAAPVLVARQSGGRHGWAGSRFRLETIPVVRDAAPIRPAHRVKRPPRSRSREKAVLECSFDQSRRDDGERDRHVDVTDAAFVAGGNLLRGPTEAEAVEEIELSKSPRDG